MQYQLNQSRSNREFSETSNDTQPISCASKSKCTHARSAISLALLLTLPVAFAGSSIAAEHKIQLAAEETNYDDGLGNKLLAYKMVKHKIDGVHVTDRYSNKATIPGPTIVLNEGDTVELTLVNNIDNVFPHTHIANLHSIAANRLVYMCMVFITTLKAMVRLK